MTETVCAQCGATERVRWVSVDMDIPPVPLCVLCWWRLFTPWDGEERA